jgi:serine/threonine-protein kinase RsbW
MPKEINLTLKNDFKEFSKISQFLEKLGQDQSIPAKIIFQINLSLEEIFNNILLHGYRDGNEHEISFRFLNEQQKIIIVIEDDAEYFNPLEAAEPDTTSSLDDRQAGGLGIHLVRSMMDRLDYKRKDNKNILTLEKDLSKIK